jgi:membrane protein implicated in regulation of membrane protease activity
MFLKLLGEYRYERKQEVKKGMEPTTIGLIMIVAGILMLIAEASAPGFFIAIPATIVLVLGIFGLIAPEEMFFSWVSPFLAVAVAVPMTVVSIFLYQRLAPPEKPTTTVGTSLVGRQGLVIETIFPKDISGKVKIDNQEWSATANTEIPCGEAVVVVESRGVHVIVEKIKERR